MKTINNKPAVVGMFILLGLAILVVAIFTLGGQKRTFVKSFTIDAVFNDVSGLLIGANIWYAGVKVGTVKKINFYGNSQVQVTMSIEKKSESFIHRDARAKIGSDGLIGNKIIVIYGGQIKTPSVTEGDFLQVDKALSTDDMLATLQINNKNLEAITNDFKSIGKKIDSGQGTLAALINDPNMAAQLNKTIDNLQTTAANFKAISINSKKVISNLQDVSQNLTKPGYLINDLTTDTTIYTTLKVSMEELQLAVKSANQFTGNIKNASEKFSQKDNAVGLLLNDSSAASSLKITLTNLQAGSKKLDEDLEALQHNFLLKHFFKKKNKQSPNSQ